MDKTVIMNDNPMMIFWVFGKIGAGKTSYCRFHSEKQNCNVLHLGKMCREKYGALSMSKDKNPIAPESAEKYVRELVTTAINSTGVGEVLYIDGMPRKPSQVRWIYENFDQSFIDNNFILFTCGDTVRKARLNKRDKDNIDDKALMSARLKSESESILRVVEELLVLKSTFMSMSFVCYDNTRNDPCFKFGIDEKRIMVGDTYESRDIEKITFKHSVNLSLMFEDISTFSDMTLKRTKTSMQEIYKKTVNLDKCLSTNDGVLWARRFINAVKREVDELLEHLPDHWWSHDKIDLRAARVELVDIWHFLISASWALGMDAEFFADTFYKKLKINIERQINGKYYKKNKGIIRDDEQIGKSERKE